MKTDSKQFGDFLPGELNELVEEVERDIRKGDVLDCDEAFEMLRNMSKRALKGSGAPPEADSSD